MRVAGEELGIGEYGLIADGLTCALAGRDGNIGWLCVPRFDSPAVLAGLLDNRGRGGECRWVPEGAGAGQQHYLQDTNVLVTEFGQGAERVQITDFMPAHFDGGDAPGFGDGAVCRWAEARGGAVTLKLSCAPRPNYGPHARRQGTTSPLPAVPC